MKQNVHKIAMIFVFLASFAVTVNAHRLEPAYLEIIEQQTGQFGVLWKRPLVGGSPMNIAPKFPASCQNLTEPSLNILPRAAVQRWLIKCDNEGLVDQFIHIAGLPSTQTDTLLRLEFMDGRTFTTVLKPDNSSYLVPAKMSKTKVASSYIILGIEHIWGGIDHLFFVLGLLLIVPSTVLLVKTITAFTFAHSVTLAMAALGFVHVPQSPVEAVIALSIVFLAMELSKLKQGKPGLTARNPWLVALAFGLLHGFGFAGSAHRNRVAANGDSTCVTLLQCWG